MVNLVGIPIYFAWLILGVIEYVVSLALSGFYIYMTALYDFEWLYTLARNKLQKDVTNFAFWYSVGILGVDCAFLVVPVIQLIVYVLQAALGFSVQSDMSAIKQWLLGFAPPMLALAYTLPFFISSFSWASLMRVLQSY